MGWRSWQLGRRTKYTWNDFDGHGTVFGVVTEKHDDHLIVEADGMNLWVDDDTADMFS